MDEAKAQNIIAHYVERVWKVKLAPYKTGPDFRHKGNAIEVKGSNFKVSKVVGQFSRYATEFNEFGIAFPIDALNGTNLFYLYVLGTFWYPTFRKFLSVFLIFERKESYGVLRISDAGELLRRILEMESKITVELEEKQVLERINKMKSIIKDLDALIRQSAGKMVDSDTTTEWFTK